MPSESKSDDENELFNYALELPEVLAKKDKKHMVLVFDEFQEVIRIAGEDALKVMRSYVTGRMLLPHETRVSSPDAQSIVRSNST